MWRRFRPYVRDLVGDVLYASRLTRPARAARGLLTVVTFHRVLPPEHFEAYPLREIAVTTDEFEWFVAFFGRHYTILPLPEAYRRWNAYERTARPLLAITFDDGQLDNFLHACPILERAGVRGSFYVPVDAIEDDGTLWHDRLAYAADGLLKKDASTARAMFSEIGVTNDPDDHTTVVTTVERVKSLPTEERLDFVARMEKALPGPVRPEWDGMMSWAQLKTMANAGHEIGSHSMSHQILPLLDDAALANEIHTSRAVLEDKLDRPIQTFCYPNGDYDDRTLARVRGEGYRLGVTTKWGPNGDGADPYQLHRVDVQGQHARTTAGAMSEPRMTWRMSRYFSGPN
ncbi:MAG: polysaccharide deacetylase family protein [Deltaproteobacteria bacterium]